MAEAATEQGPMSDDPIRGTDGVVEIILFSCDGVKGRQCVNGPELTPTNRATLSVEARNKLREVLIDAYDHDNQGWGTVQKWLDRCPVRCFFGWNKSGFYRMIISGLSEAELEKFEDLLRAQADSSDR